MNNYEVFVTVVKQGSFSAAAKVLHRSPSAISKLMAQLEQKLGIQLFDRTTRTLKMTEAGQMYYARAVDIVRRVNDAESELKEFSGEPCGLIRITFPNALSSSPIIAVLADFAQRYPKVTFDMNVSIDKKNLLEDNLDFAFRVGPLDDSGMIAIKLFDIAPAFCASPEFIETHGFPSNLQELLELPLLIPSNINVVKQSKALQPDLDWSRINHLHSGVDIPTFMKLARAGFSATFCFKHLLQEYQDRGELVDITPSALKAKLPVYLVYQNYQYMPIKHRVFVDVFKQAFQISEGPHKQQAAEIAKN